MSIFQSYRYVLATAKAELDSFETWLSGAGFVTETEIVGQIRAREHMICLLGPAGNISAPNLVKWELNIHGLYRSDLVLGNNNRRRFLFVEFEGAEEFSLFGRSGTAQNRNWSHQLEHGFGQIVDWASFYANERNSALLTQNFGGEIQQPSFLLICGRDAGVVGPLERQRLNFRRSSVHVAGINSETLTFDEMARAMRDSLECGFRGDRATCSEIMAPVIPR